MSTSSKINFVSPRYRRIFDTYYKNLADERHADLLNISQSFYHFNLRAIFNLDDVYFMFDKYRTELAVKSYWYDIIRHKEYHFSPTEKADTTSAKKYISDNNISYEDIIHLDEKYGGAFVNEAKQAAYMVKWLTKIKPFMLLSKSDIQTCSYDECPSKVIGETKIKDIHENLVVSLNEHIALTYACGVMNLDITKHEDWFDKTVYHLVYRGADEASLTEMFEEKR